AAHRKLRPKPREGRSRPQGCRRRPGATRTVRSGRPPPRRRSWSWPAYSNSPADGWGGVKAARCRKEVRRRKEARRRARCEGGCPREPFIGLALPPLPPEGGRLAGVSTSQSLDPVGMNAFSVRLYLVV